MVVIKKIEVQEVPEDIFQLILYIDQPSFKGLPPAYSEITKEMIHGRRFRSGTKEICIGMSREVEQALGLPLQAYENMEKRIEALVRENTRLDSSLSSRENFLEEIMSANLFKRFKYLFTSKL